MSSCGYYLQYEYIAFDTVEIVPTCVLWPDDSPREEKGENIKGLFACLASSYVTHSRFGRTNVGRSQKEVRNTLILMMGEEEWKGTECIRKSKRGTIPEHVPVICNMQQTRTRTKLVRQPAQHVKKEKASKVRQKETRRIYVYEECKTLRWEEGRRIIWPHWMSISACMLSLNNACRTMPLCQTAWDRETWLPNQTNVGTCKPWLLRQVRAYLHLSDQWSSD